MAIIKTYKAFNGESMGVAFSDGKGETDNPWLIQRFKESGYKVEEAKEDEKEEALEVPEEQKEEDKEEAKEDEKNEPASTKKASPAKTRSAASKAKAK